MVDFYTRQERNRAKYHRAIVKVCEEIFKKVNKDEEPLQIIKLISELSQTYEFEQYVNSLVKGMVINIATENAKDWRDAVLKSHKPNEFYKYLMQNTEGQIQGLLTNASLENASLIKSIPPLWAQKATAITTQATLEGRRASDVRKDILDLYPHITEERAQLIARTEISKTSSQLVKVRSQAVGIDWYTWKTAHDQRVRESHRLMNDVICNFNNPPSPEKLAGEKYLYGVYNAGEIFNCRCYPEPIIDYNDIKFPARVCYNGQIVRMKKADFLAIA